MVGKTQSDLLAIAMYGIAVVLVIERVEVERSLQRCYADDGSVSRELEYLRHVLDNVLKYRKHCGQNVNPSTCPGSFFFENQNNLTWDIDENHGWMQSVLGFVTGSEGSWNYYIEETAEEYNKACTNLSQLAETSPQNACSCPE